MKFLPLLLFAVFLVINVVKLISFYIKNKKINYEHLIGVIIMIFIISMMIFYNFF